MGEVSAVERVARAIWQAREAQFPKFTQRREPDDFDRQSGAWALCMGEARAAIEAMRWVTLEMHRAGNERLDLFDDVQEATKGQVVDVRSNVCWDAMIDAALLKAESSHGA